MRRRRFSELSPPARFAVVVLGAIQIALFVAANRDISRRPAGQIRGSKAKWRAICLLNTVGPLSYFRWGRLPPAELSSCPAGGNLAGMTFNRTSPQWAALPVLLAGAFMVVLDFFIVNVALPSIATDLGAGDSSLEWVVAGYGLTFAAFLITAGRLGDAVGRRRVYVVGHLLFTLASAACGLAPSPATLVAARVAQGVAGAVVMPQVLAIIGVTYKGPDYVRALSIYGVVLGLAAVGGQVVGGALVETDIAGLGWRSCFLINVPVGLAALLAAPRLVPESRADEGGRIDVAGAILVAAGLTAVLLPLIEGREHGWPLWTWLSLGAAPLILGGFLRRQRRLGVEGGALLDLRLFQERGFSAGIVTQLFLASAQASFFVFLALYLQIGRGLGALEAGLVFTILAVAYVVTSAPAPALTARFGRSVVAAGGVALTLGLVALAAAVAEIGTAGSLVALVPGLLLVGAGIGLCFTPLTSTVLQNVDPARAGSASGAMSTMQQVGYALGVAITGIVYFGAAGEGVGHAFQLSLIQLAAVAAGIVVASRLLPRVSGAKSGINLTPSQQIADTVA
jgi:EmrB/QacA subfamily drug resistance transporter